MRRCNIKKPCRGTGQLQKNCWSLAVRIVPAQVAQLASDEGNVEQQRRVQKKAQAPRTQHVVAVHRARFIRKKQNEPKNQQVPAQTSGSPIGSARDGSDEPHCKTNAWIGQAAIVPMMGM